MTGNREGETFGQETLPGLARLTFLNGVHRRVSIQLRLRVQGGMFAELS